MMIDARSETAATKPAFSDPLKSRRCFIPADGFYDWLRTGKAKQPFCFEVSNGEAGRYKKEAALMKERAISWSPAKQLRRAHFDE